MLFALLIALGVGAVFSIPKSEDPITEFPASSIAIVLPGADAEQMERLVAIPIEDARQRHRGHSRNPVLQPRRAGGGLGVEFEWGTDPEEKFGEVVRELNVVRPRLPDGHRRYPHPPLQSRASGDRADGADQRDASFRQMEAYAKALRDAIERAPGVQQADVWGAPPAEVRVAADLDRLAAYRLPLSAVADALQREGLDTPIGAVEAGGRRFNLQASGSFNSLDEIRGVALRAEDGSVLTVGDVADVSWANDERAHITRFNGQRAVFVSARAQARRIGVRRDRRRARARRCVRGLACPTTSSCIAGSINRRR